MFFTFGLRFSDAQCFCTLPRLTVSSLRKNAKKNSQIAVFLVTMLLKTSQIAVFFDSSFKNPVNSGVLGHGKLKNIAICSGFCLTEYKNTAKYGPT